MMKQTQNLMNNMSVKSMQRSMERVKSDKSIDENPLSKAVHNIPSTERIQANTSRQIRKAAQRERDQLIID